MRTRTRLLAAVIASLVVGIGATGHDRWSAGRAAETGAVSQMGPVRSILLGLAAGFVVLAGTGLRRPPSGRRP
ncbi:hypothetical protein [Methylobacterium iners]|uniref:DUF3185 family protein n=1 Tax=Methylobacterium iners TaxID=418707 RepID=A0ABQ4RVM7_9HYPH|nr:hypothetical protein [Methylobacterium iners]GJD94252.1 hypothetical protein OCOJLMKI_1454 [Methylobacterium iners]